MGAQNHEIITHPKGERLTSVNSEFLLDTFAGRVHVEWDTQQAVSPLGQLPFFIEFLKVSQIFESWVCDCPLQFTSPNSPKKRDVLGSLLLSILSGHKRYAHITGLRFDGVNPELLGMSKVVSEDSMRRSLLKMDEDKSVEWLQKHLYQCYEPLLSTPWILDIDTTIKPIHGKQEGAEVSYNPHKPGRPSHCYHTYMISNLRLMLDVEVSAGNESSAKHCSEGLWKLLDRIPKKNWPKFLRGDCAFGNQSVIEGAQTRGIDYLFKLRCTTNVKKLIKNLMQNDCWEYAGLNCEAAEGALMLDGWTQLRRVIVVRRKVSRSIGALTKKDKNQLEFKYADTSATTQLYEYTALVTSLSDDLGAIVQHYQDRADVENAFDELKNQWGWGGYMTKDIKRCRIMARTVGLIYNWWSIFVRMVVRNKRKEAITSRPLLMHGVAIKTKHAGQIRVKISGIHAKAKQVIQSIVRINSFFNTVKKNAEQLSRKDRWVWILKYAYRKYFEKIDQKSLLTSNPALAF